MPPRERQKLQPRNVPEYFREPAPYNPNRNVPEYFPMNNNFQPNQSGIMLALANNPTVNRIQGIYNRVDPFLPEVDWGDKKVGYDINRDFWGGNLNIGGEYDLDDGYQLGINWGTTR